MFLIQTAHIEEFVGAETYVKFCFDALVSELNGRLFSKEEIYQWDFLYFKFLCFQLAFIIKMEEESWTLSTSVPGNIETLKIDRNTEIPEDLGAVITTLLMP